MASVVVAHGNARTLTESWECRDFGDGAEPAIVDGCSTFRAPHVLAGTRSSSTLVGHELLPGGTTLFSGFAAEVSR
ncbi:hypothetical protein UA75_16260 [Actinoalloteichus sp. GBA129-24]|uniref:Uncharacterized protein n=1 Tax=Actinoalloteichus fjordicus TaxID=1612552 RepID=A0AAC9LD89_9PSEU|nr:hypothetical protein UA74_15695 [Actinoalloteichus fjordicus]APU21260.1 hypothetical protein UA75_16260 [Actinoalloteichus sp. GBA129-24]